MNKEIKDVKGVLYSPDGGGATVTCNLAVRLPSGMPVTYSGSGEITVVVGGSNFGRKVVNLYLYPEQILETIHVLQQLMSRLTPASSEVGAGLEDSSS